MRRIGVLLVLVAASIGGLLAVRPAAAPKRSAGTQERHDTTGTEAERPPEPTTALGTVVDAETEAPVARAQVTLYRLPRDLPTAPLVKTFVADDLGRFSVPLPQPADCARVVVDAEGYPPQAEWFRPEGMEIRLERGVERTFAIVDDEGRPGAGAEVGLYADWRLCLVTVRADVHGVATVRLTRGTSILVRYAGCAFEDHARAESLFVLGPGFSIGGKIVDSAGRPVPGAFVALRQGTTCKDVSEYAPTVLTGPDGRFLFRGIHGCVCEMTVRAQGYCEAVVTAVPGDEERRIVLPRHASVSGTVVMPDGSPAPGAQVRPDRNYEDRVAVATDGEGRFRIDALGPRKQSLLAFAAPDMSGATEITPTEGTTTESPRVVLHPSTRSYVRVQVTDERGRAVPGVKVIRHFWRSLALTDVEGLATVALEDPEIDVKLHLVPDKERSPRFCESEFETRTSSSPAGAPVGHAVLREAALVRLDAHAPDGTRVAGASATFLGGDSWEAEHEQGWYLDPAATGWARSGLGP